MQILKFSISDMLTIEHVAGVAAYMLLTSVGLKSMMQYDALEDVGTALCRNNPSSWWKVMQQIASVEVVMPTAGKAGKVHRHPKTHINRFLSFFAFYNHQLAC
eukprot:s4708_g2.t1